MSEKQKPSVIPCNAPAEEILRLAKQHDIPLRQDPALVGTLAQLEIGPPLPPELFRAVAEVLAFVYKMNDKAK